jgi:hypothetical protein
MAQPTCQTCRWFDDSKQASAPFMRHDRASNKTENVLRGLCRFAAPQNGFFPHVWVDDWCGGHLPRIITPQEPR